MKKITLLTFLLVSAFLFGQSSLPINYENGTTTAAFQFGNLSYANIANPDTNGNTSTRVLEVVKSDTAEWAAGFGYETPGSAFIDLANGTSFTMKVWAPIAGQTIRFQIQGGLNGAPTFQRDVVINNAETWTEVTFDFAGQAGSTGTEQYSVLVIQPNYAIGCEGGGCSTVGAGNGGTWYIDDIVQVGAAAPTCTDGIQNGNETGVDCGGPDCAACPPSCTDGIQNQDETGIDCGGSTCPDCPAENPTTDSPQSSSTGTDLYVYSDLGNTSNTVTNFNFNAFAGSGTYSQVDIEGLGNNAGLIENLSFYGAQWDAVDLIAGGFSFVHINYYATTTTEFNFYLIDQTAGIAGGSSDEPRYRFGGSTPDATLVTGSWQSVFIPLQHFLDDTPNGNYDLNDIFQWKFDGNGNVYFDNIYFSSSNVLGTDKFTSNDFTVSPNPTNNIWNVRTKNQNITSIAVFDLLGKEVKRLIPNAIEANIDASGLTEGIYLAKISSKNGTRTIKLVKN